MPNISSFFGIIIYMYYKHGQHKGPYFHARYQGNDASFSIENGELLAGNLPPKVVKLIMEWAHKHQEELLENWERALRKEPLRQIIGADLD